MYPCAPRMPPKLTHGGRCTEMQNTMLRSGECRCGTVAPTMLLLFVFFSTQALAQTPRALNLGAAQYLSFMTSSAWVLGNHRNEFRIQNFGQRSADYSI